MQNEGQQKHSSTGLKWMNTYDCKRKIIGGMGLGGLLDYNIFWRVVLVIMRDIMATFCLILWGL